MGKGSSQLPSQLEAAAMLVDTGRVLGLTDAGQREHLASLGLSPDQVDIAMGGLANYYLSSQAAPTPDQPGSQA